MNFLRIIEMSEPKVSVGILCAKEISFTFSGIYSSPSVDVVTGNQKAEMSPSGMSFIWNDKSYTSLEFEPTSYDGDTFELEGVTIGIDFHWERKENQRFKGALRLIVSDGKIQAINLIDVEDYLVSVISSEMSSKASLPLLQAHAVISRSWLLSQMNRRLDSKRNNSVKNGMIFSHERIIRWWDHEDHDLFDVCADDHCQRYQGLTRIDSGMHARSAVNDTRGVVLVYDNKICDARFSKCCGGMFELFGSCWDDTTPYPYLSAGRDNMALNEVPDLTIEENAREWILSRPDSFCATDDDNVLSQVLNGYDRERNDFYRWTENMGQNELVRLLKEKSDIDVGEIIDLKPLQRGTSARIVMLEIIGTKGRIIIGKELMIRRSLSTSHLLSSAFVVERHFTHDNAVPSSFTLHGAGWGHGVGLCQIGAAVMGERGYSFDEILTHYYRGAELKRMY